jgi:DNA-directed RNA polymerase subunit beta'
VLTVLPARTLLVRSGAMVPAGAALTDGEISAAGLLRTARRAAAQDYLLREVRGIYRLHGLEIDDRHFEVLLARLFAYVRVTSPGDTGLLPGQILERRALRAHNARARAAGKARAKVRSHLLGLTRVASSSGLLAAASFQRAVAVLTEAALAGQAHPLDGLKENVMLGRLVPVGTGWPSLRGVRAKVAQRGPMKELS